MTLRAIFLAAAVSAVSASLATAQTHDNPFRFGTTLSGFGGLTGDSGGVAPATGLELGWEMTHLVTVEGTTIWSVPGTGQQDFGVTIGPRFNLAHNRRRVPFVAAGVGMYRASFDRLTGQVPSFYADRLQPADRVDTHRTFDDFVLSVGGGAEFFIHDHWAVRPDVRLMTVFSGSDVRWITAFGGHLAYHFDRRHLTD